VSSSFPCSLFPPVLSPATELLLGSGVEEGAWGRSLLSQLCKVFGNQSIEESLFCCKKAVLDVNRLSKIVSSQDLGNRKYVVYWTTLSFSYIIV